MDDEDERRQAVGRRIKRARRRAGYRSQRAFAEKIGINETSVARAETGDRRVGDSVFEAIEIGLDWPPGCIDTYLHTGDESPFKSPDQPTPEPEPIDPADELLDQAYDLYRADGLSHEEAMAKIEIQKLRLEQRRRAAQNPSPGRVGDISPAG